MSKAILIILLLFFVIIPPFVQYLWIRLVYVKKYKKSWHIAYLLKFLTTLLFLPVIAYLGSELGIVPINSLSQVFLLATVLFSIMGVFFAVKRNVIAFYTQGVFAAFMEEILFRGIIYSLCLVIWGNVIVAIVVSSVAFGLWHLKNYPINGKRNTIIQVLMTGLVYGPIFGLLRYWTGDIWLAALAHYLNDTFCTFAPKWAMPFSTLRDKNYSLSDERMDPIAGG